MPDTGELIWDMAREVEDQINDPHVMELDCTQTSSRLGFFAAVLATRYPWFAVHLEDAITRFVRCLNEGSPERSRLDVGNEDQRPN